MGKQDINNKSKWMTLVGSNFIHLAAGITGVWGSSNIYYLSYFHYHDYRISPLTNSILLIVTVIPLSCIILLSTKISDYLGYQMTIRGCAIIFFISQFFLHITFTIITLTLFGLIIPISTISVSLIPTINILWSHFLKKKSLITACSLAFFGLGTIMWNMMFLHMVNPNNEQAQIDQSGLPYFSEPVVKNVYQSTKIIFFICSIIYLFGAFLMRIKIKKNKQNDQNKQIIKNAIESNKNDDFQNKNHQNNEQGPKISDVRLDINSNQQQVKQIEEIESSPSSQQIKINQDLCTALKDQRCFIIFALLVLIDIYPIYLLNNFKEIFIPYINNDHYLGYCMMGNTITNIVGTFVWGYFGESKGVLKTLLVVVSAGLVAGILGFGSTNSTILLIFMLLIGLCDRGMETIAGPALIQIFNLRTATLLLPYKGLSLIIGYLIAPLVQILTSNFLNPFQYLLFLFMFCVISFILGFYYYCKFSHQGLKSEKFIKDDPQQHQIP